jgi:hypothetical protein
MTTTPRPPVSGDPESFAPSCTPMGCHSSSKSDENRLAVSVLMGLEHRRTGKLLSELALTYGLTAEGAAFALSKSIIEMQDALGTYVRTLDTPLPVTGPSLVRNRKRKMP